MKIEVIGSGCQTCKSLFEITKRVIKEMGLDEKDVIYITDFMELAKRGVMKSPALFVDGKLAMVGFSPDVKIVKEKIEKVLEKEEE
ncbi:MAG: thioredoxin family protein [Patescibacteria group bacterium]